MTPLNRPLLQAISQQCTKLPKLYFKRGISKQSTRRAAVLIPLCTVQNQPSILFNIRSNTVPTHKGEICFPGGHVNLDESLEECAIREFREELGLETVELLGKLCDVQSSTGVRVTAFVGHILEPDLNIESIPFETTEVEEVFSLPIMYLLDSDNLRYKDELPVYRTQFPEHQIWGLTSFILNQFLTQVYGPTINGFDSSVRTDYQQF